MKKILKGRSLLAICVMASIRMRKVMREVGSSKLPVKAAVFALALAALMLFAGHAAPSLAQTGQQPQYGLRKPPCGCYCGGKTPGYVVFEDKNCAGILAADACGEHMASLPTEQREKYCKKIKAKGKITSCPVFEPHCGPKEKPKSSEAPSPDPGQGKEPTGADCRTVADAAADIVKKNGGTEKEQQLAYERAKYNCMEKKKH